MDGAVSDTEWGDEESDDSDDFDMNVVKDI